MFLRRGDRGSSVLALQQALQKLGFPPGGLDGIFGPKTERAVKEYQRERGLAVDGIVGELTWGQIERELGMKTDPPQEEHIPEGTVSAILRSGSQGSLTRYLQQMLKALGYLDSVDGIFGDNTQAAVLAFQKKHGLEEDGIVGSVTWKKLFEVYRIPGLSKGDEGIADAARYELELGFAEDYGNNITPYGIWYGMNGQPWCAMFVSWCAYQAGVLESVIPRFAYCPYGVNLYREKGRFEKAGNYLPKSGDTVFFINRNTGEINHTGIVTEVSGTVMTTVEGNSGDCVRALTYALDDSCIYGYGRNS